MSLMVTVRDEQTGEEASKQVQDGDYLLICVEPCYLDVTQTYAPGTHVLTIKGQTARNKPEGHQQEV